MTTLIDINKSAGLVAGTSLVYFKDKLYCRTLFCKNSGKPNMMIFSADTLKRDTIAEEAIKYDDAADAISLN